MTEYDYSPDAIERHLSKQAAIADWVRHTEQHDPANPFVPIPGEHPPSETFFSPPQAQYPSNPYQYPYQTPQAAQQQPYPAYYAAPNGVISPTYLGGNKRHHHKHHHSSSHHTSGSKSLRPSPHTSHSALPIVPNGLLYAPTPQRSVSTPPSVVNVPVASTSGQSFIGYQAHQKQLAHPLVSPPMMPNQAQMQSYPFQYMTPPAQQVVSPPYSRSSSYTIYSNSGSRPSSAHTKHSHSRSHSHTPQGYSQYPGPMQVPPYGQTMQASSSQPMVVPFNNGYVIIPNSGQNSQQPQYVVSFQGLTPFSLS
ncbi:hypothetical protein CPC08DRAFT_295279 [Agrocybe pediades]|nr:hypothetical protein CPC08DRAFT_295279 [Agrocybe pediades]